MDLAAEVSASAWLELNLVKEALHLAFGEVLSEAVGLLAYVVAFHIPGLLDQVEEEGI